VAPLEVIVCNDGSTDDLEGALAPCRREIVLLHQENGGDAAAKKAAACETAGDFVLILDADDVYLPERIAALTELGHAPDLDILTTDGLLVAGGCPVCLRPMRLPRSQRPLCSRAAPYRHARRSGATPTAASGNRGRGVAGGVPTESSPLRSTNTNKLDGIRFGGWRRTHGSTRWAAWPIERLGDGCHAVFALNGRSEGEVPIGGHLCSRPWRSPSRC
jgi:glycosyltransferase involved in cell wall biosynthesis